VSAGDELVSLGDLLVGENQLDLYCGQNRGKVRSTCKQSSDSCA
jgi:hypothetical protein